VRETPRKQRYRITQSLITVGMTVVSVAACFGWNWSSSGNPCDCDKFFSYCVSVRSTTGCLSCKLYCNKDRSQFQSTSGSNWMVSLLGVLSAAAVNRKPEWWRWRRWWWWRRWSSRFVISLLICILSFFLSFFLYVILSFSIHTHTHTNARI